MVSKTAFPDLRKVALYILTMFSSTYSCEAAPRHSVLCISYSTSPITPTAHTQRVLAEIKVTQLPWVLIHGDNTSPLLPTTVNA